MPRTLTIRIQDPPPSVNRAWRNMRGHMVKSAEMTGWQSGAIVQMRRQVAQPLPLFCYYSVQMFVPRSKTKIDLDNVPKGVLDALRTSGVTPDDRYLVAMNLEWWAGNYLLIYVNHERLDKWSKIMMASKSLIRKLARSGA